MSSITRNNLTMAIKLTEQQYQSFEELGLHRYINELIDYYQTYFAKMLDKLLTPPLLSSFRQFLKTQINVAKTKGLDNRGATRTWIDLTILLGIHFETDPQYYFLTEMLESDDLPLQKAEQLYQSLVRYYETTLADLHLNTSLSLLSLQMLPVLHSAKDRHAFLSTYFPTKMAHFDHEEDCENWLHENERKAEQIFMVPTPKQILLVTLLSLFLGKNFDENLIYYWIDMQLLSSQTTEQHALQIMLNWLHEWQRRGLL